MPRYVIFMLLGVFLIAGCECRSAQKSPVAIKIGSTDVTAGEFEAAFRQALHTGEDTGQARREFLDTYVMRMLLLKEAEKLGLDRDPAFLKDVEYFWQQSLIKLVLDRKTKELLAGRITITDGDVRDYYHENKDKYFKDKELSSVYDQIRWIILNNRQKEAVSDWLRDLKNAAKVEIDYKLLNITGQGGEDGN